MVEYSRMDTGAAGRTIVGGKAAVATFLLMLFAFVVESQLTQVCYATSVLVSVH